MLTPCEHEVACMFAAGIEVPAIARRRGRNRNSVGSQLRRALAKLGVERDRRALALALQDVAVGRCRGRVAGRAVGWSKGDALQIVGGRYVGRMARFDRFEGARQVRVVIGGGMVAVLRTNVERA